MWALTNHDERLSMLRLLSTCLLLVLAVICIFVAIANREEVTVVLGPVALPHIPLFFVFFAGLVMGIIVIGLRAGVSKIALRHKLSKAHKAISALQDERDALAAERDSLAARVRPEDELLKRAQTSDLPAVGTLTGPRTPSQTVLPG